jgi:hypothetical protein
MLKLLSACALGFNTGWLLADWLVEKINPDMTSYRMLLDVTVPSNKNRCNKCLILIRLNITGLLWGKNLTITISIYDTIKLM